MLKTTTAFEGAHSITPDQFQLDLHATHNGLVFHPLLTRRDATMLVATLLSELERTQSMAPEPLIAAVKIHS